MVERKHTTTAQRSSENSAWNPERSSRFTSCWKKMQTTLNYTWRQSQKNPPLNSSEIDLETVHIDEIELEALAELMDHPIEHVIFEINMFPFSEIEEGNESMKLEPCYGPQKYYKDTETNSHVHEIYTTTIGYDTGTVFLIIVNGRTVRALLDTGAERSCMNLDTYEKLKLTNMNTSFMPTLNGATGHDMLTKGITTFDFTINEHTFTNSFIVLFCNGGGFLSVKECFQ